MEKNNSILLKSILGGVVACFICIALVFLIPSKGEVRLDRVKTILPSQNNEEEEEILLGDVAHCSAYNYTCPNGGSLTGSQCTIDTVTSGVGPDSCSGSWTNGQCHTISKYNATKTTCKSCSEGYTLNGNSCVISSCPAGQGADDSASSGCSNCASNAVSPAGSTTCTECTGGKVPNSSKTVCVMSSCPAGQGLDSNGSCAPCGDGYVSPDGSTSCSTKCENGQVPNADRSACVSPGCGAGQGKDTYATTGCSYCAKGYYSGNNDDVCHKCPEGKTSPAGSDSIVDCKEIQCPAGQGKDTNATSGCSNCAADYYSGENDNTCYKCPDNTHSSAASTSIADCKSACETGYYWEQGSTACKPCPEGTISPKGASSVSQCMKECTRVTQQGECAMRSDCEWNNNACGPKGLAITMNGGGTAYVTPETCKSFTFTLNYSNGGAVYSASSITWSEAGCSGKSCTIKVCGKGCVPSWTKTVTATLAGKTATGKVVVTSYREWTDRTWNKEPNTKLLIYNTTALDEETCIGYSDPYTENGITKYKKKWSRCCGSGGGGSNPPVDPTPTPSTPVIPHCYVDDSGEYHWTDTPGGSWKIIEGVTKEIDCHAEEEEACYLDTAGEYVWGKYATKDGYTRITSIVDSASCKKPTAEEACYKNEDGDYRWSATPLEGYTKVEGVKTPADCGASENPGCYLHGNDFVWGKYSKITGYIFIENITEQAKCKVPDADACYQNKNGDYVWGKYGDDSDYKLVPSITDISQCKNTPDVPKTDMNVSKVIYIFMAILMISGIGFICYSSAVKKTD